MHLFVVASMVATLASTAARAACAGQDKILANPVDPSARGPYPVGAMLGSVRVATGRLGLKRSITVEVWYPAMPSSEVGLTLLVYDIREHVPRLQQKKLIDAANVTSQKCDCFRTLPVADGSFPVVLMVHGTAAFRTASLHQQTQWASRGFVVIAADHPGIQLKDLLGIVDFIPPPKRNQEGDVRGMLKAFADISALPDFSALQGHLDMSRVGIAGHSIGGMALKRMGDIADVLIPMSGGVPEAGARLKSTLVLSAQNDTIVGYEGEVDAYESSEVLPKRFAAVERLGHLFCSDLCWIGKSAGGIVKIAEDHGIMAASAFAGLGENGCSYLNVDTSTDFLEPECGWQFTNYVSAAAFEEVLRCDANMTYALAHVKAKLRSPSICPKNMVYDYRESLNGVLV
jgi:dienelactone hydrolase